MKSPRTESTIARFAVWVAPALIGVSCGVQPAGSTDRQDRQDHQDHQILALNAGEAGVDFTRGLQRITGFGASSAWTATDLSDSLSDQLFSADTGIGLSLLRVHINTTGDTGELAAAKKAVARGARVWATPWSPPGAWKDNGSDINGGSLLPSHYQDWANRLALFAKNMSDQGVPLLMLSAQNEPNWMAAWETCLWTNTQLATFIGANLGPALQAQGVATKVLGPETIDWNTIQSYGNAILQNATARGFIGAIATHSYGGTAAAYAAPAQNGKEFWVTELDSGSAAPIDPGITSGLRVAKLIHDHLTIAQVNAWHYWWLLPRTDQGPTNAALTDGTTLTRRAHVMGNWSKFVRPGFVRVDATAAPQTGVLVTAFRDPASQRGAIVAVNQGTADVAQTFVLTGGSATSGGGATSIVPWVTSASLALSQRPAITVAGSTFSYVLPASSVTTFAGNLALAGTGTGGGGATGGGGIGGAGGRVGTGGAGGRPGTGGGTSTGGGPGTGGRPGTGGVIGTGGTAGGAAGGVMGTGGSLGTGGVSGTGGSISTGGNNVTGGSGVTGGAPGSDATGGATGGANGGRTGGGAPKGGCACEIKGGDTTSSLSSALFLSAASGIGFYRRRRKAGIIIRR